MVQVMSAWGPLIYAGCLAASLSIAIGSIEGASKVLQVTPITNKNKQKHLLRKNSDTVSGSFKRHAFARSEIFCQRAWR